MIANLFHLVLSLLLMSVAVYLTAALMPGFRIRGFGTAVAVAAVYGVLNVLLYKILFFLTLPLALLTLGFVVNAFLLWLTSKIVSGMEFSGILPIFFSAIVLSVIRWLLNLLLPV